MKLGAKLNDLNPETIVPELQKMLESATVSVSYWGERKVTILPYEGSVTLDALASKYFEATCFDLAPSLSPTLADRLACDDLWITIQNLYTQTDQLLSHTFIYRYLVPLREFQGFFPNCYPIHPMNRINEWSYGSHFFRQRIFAFSDKEFAEKFPKCTPVRQLKVEEQLIYIADRKMVEPAIKRNTLFKILDDLEPDVTNQGPGSSSTNRKKKVRFE